MLAHHRHSSVGKAVNPIKINYKDVENFLQNGGQFKDLLSYNLFLKIYNEAIIEYKVP